MGEEVPNSAQEVEDPDDGPDCEDIGKTDGRGLQIQVLMLYYNSQQEVQISVQL